MKYRRFVTGSPLLAMLCVLGTSSLSAQESDSMKEEAFAVIDAHADRIGRISDAIYSYAEIGFQETKTVALLEKNLKAAGFTFERNIAGMPTAFMARYGSGKPVIGLMTDFDGVPDTSQKPGTFARTPLVPGAPGHGEGHNTHQPTLLSAALAAKAMKDRHNLPGTIIVYGGPAEEQLASRGYMTNAGIFRDVDAIFDVHIGTSLSTGYGISNLALMSVEWTFDGRSAHGGRAWQGRSALDAVEIMNVSTNFMREHMDPPSRMHYTISYGGHQPNVVPPKASVWYYFRHQTAANVWDLFSRARNAAKAAALSTDTNVSERILSATWPFNGNRELAEIVQKNIEITGQPKWSEADQQFARAYQKAMGVPQKGLPTTITPLRQATQGDSSNDTGDVTWQAPMVRITIPAKPDGELAGHHWSAGIAPATPLAHKGIATASKVIVASMLDLMRSPETVAKVRAGFQKQLAAYPEWKSLIAPTSKPPVHLNRDEMASFREALKPFEYNPDSKQSYLEFMGVAYPPAMPDSAISLETNVPAPPSADSSINWDWKKD